MTLHLIVAILACLFAYAVICLFVFAVIWAAGRWEDR